jgi:hypothetical protein
MPCNFVNTYQRFRGTCCLHSQRNLKMEEGASSETSSIYRSTRPSIPEDAILHRASNLTECIYPPLPCEDSLDRWNLMQCCGNGNWVNIQVLHLSALKNCSLLKHVVTTYTTYFNIVTVFYQIISLKQTFASPTILPECHASHASRRFTVSVLRNTSFFCFCSLERSQNIRRMEEQCFIIRDSFWRVLVWVCECSFLLSLHEWDSLTCSNSELLFWHHECFRHL